MDQASLLRPEHNQAIRHSKRPNRLLCLFGLCSVTLASPSQLRTTDLPPPIGGRQGRTRSERERESRWKGGDMTWPTHALLGINSLWLLAPIPLELVGYDFGTLAACAVLGGLLPDLDASESKIKHLKLLGTNFKPFFLPAQIVHRTDGHRGLLHSVLGLGVATLFVAPLTFWVGWAPATALLLGYASHLMGDAATKSGIRLFYPDSKRHHLLPQRWRITTGSFAEDALLPFWALGVVVLLFGHLFSS